MFFGKFFFGKSAHEGVKNIFHDIVRDILQRSYAIYQKKIHFFS